MIFLELVPRDLALFQNESSQFVSKYSLDGVNVPHISRISVSSYYASELILKKNITCIPHIKANSASIDDHIKSISKLLSLGLNSVLVVSGDKPLDQKDYFSTSAIELIRAIKSHFNSLKVFAAFDPYRTSLMEEFSYCDKKRSAGVDGFFSQPFFDLRFLHFFLDYFKDDSFYAGLSPVLTTKSKTYWQQRNRVFFPKSFSLSFETNVEFARKALSLIKQYQQHTYIMPISVNVDAYLGGIFSREID